MDEEDEGSKFCEEDIDQILQRRTHTITIESEGKGSTFAKVTKKITVRAAGGGERDNLYMKNKSLTSVPLSAG